MSLTYIDYYCIIYDFKNQPCRNRTVARHYIYTNTKKNRVIFETVQPNYVSIDDVDKMVVEKTGEDPRLNPVLIERTIRVVPDDFKLPKRKPLKKKKKFKSKKKQHKKIDNRLKR